MENPIILRHINNMKHTKEFFVAKQPKEIHILFFTVLLFFTVGIAIIIFGKIDDVVKAKGIVRTQENVSLVKNVIPGQIIEINYKPGQKVKKGDVLYKIDPKAYEAQRTLLHSEKENIELKISGTDALIESYEKNKNLVPMQNYSFYSRFEAFKNKKNELIKKSELSKYLYEEQRDNPEAIRNIKNITLREIEHEVADSELESFTAEFYSTLHSEKEKLQVEYKSVLSDLEKINSQFSFLQVKAPLDGFIQENSSLNVGDYLESNMNVLNIIPNDSKNFRVEIEIPSKDIGKIKEHLKVKYRLAAFPFFEYQGAEGFITSIDPDIRSRTENSELFYVAYADIDRTEFSNRLGLSFPIRAGLETDARIVLEKSTILFYLLRKLDFFA